VASATRGEIPIVLRALGTVTPLQTVNVKTQITGQLTEVHFQEGQMVKQGELLSQVDPRPYDVALQQAIGQLALFDQPMYLFDQRCRISGKVVRR